jgi:GntR family transcriptional regulator
VELFKVSRVTVRQAISELTNEGILISQKGGGTYVAHNHDYRRKDHDRFEGFSSNINKMGLMVRNYILSKDSLECDKNLGDTMHLTLGSPVLKMKRLRECNGMPVSLEITHINMSLVSSLDFFRDFNETMSLYTFLSEEGGLELFYANESLAAITANEEQASLLQLAEGSPILFIKRQLYTKQNQLIEYCEIYRRTDQFEFSVDYGPMK